MVIVRLAAVLVVFVVCSCGSMFLGEAQAANGYKIVEGCLLKVAIDALLISDRRKIILGGRDLLCCWSSPFLPET